jgi:1,2-diacylglycerol 3-beta-glucosyltransferase
VTAGDAVLAVFAVPVLGATGYLLLLTLLSRRTPPPALRPPHLRFDVVVPAHDEEGGIAATIASLAAMDYPSELYRVIVVADNCADGTAARAGASGAHVMVRDEPSRHGKGYALAHAFERILAEGQTSAVAVVDADTVVSPNLLRAFAAQLDAGASAVQADYAIRNADASWRTRLMSIAFATVHTLRSLARERLRLSCGLRGNGMCFATSLLSAVPHDAFSVVEDLEYGIRIGVAGHRVRYAATAHVYGDMPTGGRGSRTQRRRWEAGRSRMARLHGWPLVVRAVRMRDRVSLDLALDLLVPPLATLITLTAIGLVASAALSWRTDHVTPGSWLWLGCALGLCGYGLRGWQLSGTGARGFLDLIFVPTYVVWKLLLILKRPAHPHDEWVRTARAEAEAEEEEAP